MRELPVAELQSFLARRGVKGAVDYGFRIRRLRGGLESDVFDVRGERPNGERRASLRFVVKTLEGENVREAHVYEELVARSARSFAPDLLDVRWMGPATCLLFLERVEPERRWPWHDPRRAAGILEALARLHEAGTHARKEDAFGRWDYERALDRSANATLDLLDRIPPDHRAAPLRAGLPALRRLVERLPRLRRELLGFRLFGRTALHGDVHSGNALVARHGRLERLVLLDWGRARMGSPLEDVSSWLQSLGYWEPEAKRRHDSLLRVYLESRGMPPHLHRELRDVYWIAAASNTLSGALLFHLARAFDPHRPTDEALPAARDLLRIVRRADACVG